LEGQEAAPWATVKPAVGNCFAGAKPPSDGELIRGDAATIVSPQVPPVEVTDADWQQCAACGGVSDRRTGQPGGDLARRQD